MNELVKGIPNMSEPQNEEPVYVVNKQRRESEAVVHMPDCEKIYATKSNRTHGPKDCPPDSRK